MKVILLIDDEASIRDLLKDYLTQLGYHVHAAKDGWEGIRRLNSDCKYDAVLTDIGMPEIDGNEIARHLKKTDKSHTPILAITGLSDSSERSGLFDCVIRKPFSLNQLKTILQSLIR